MLLWELVPFQIHEIYPDFAPCYITMISSFPFPFQILGANKVIIKWTSRWLTHFLHFIFHFRSSNCSLLWFLLSGYILAFSYYFGKYISFHIKNILFGEYTLQKLLRGGETTLFADPFNLFLAGHKLLPLLNILITKNFLRPQRSWESQSNPPTQPSHSVKIDLPFLSLRASFSTFVPLLK